MAGTVEQYDTSNGVRWRYRYDKGGTPRRQGSKAGFRTKRDAERGLRDQLAALEVGIDPSPITLREWLEHWQPSVAPTTAVEYRSAARIHLIPALGAVRLRDLRAEHVERLHERLETRGLASKSRANIHWTLRAALRDAQRRGLLVTNPAAAVPAPTPRSAEMRAWSRKELQTFLQAASRDVLSPLWRLMSTTGIRRGEAAGLQWNGPGRSGAAHQAVDR